MNKVWNIDDSLYCQQLTADYLEEAVDLMNTAFYPDENVSRSIGISEDVEAMLELRDLMRATAKDGVSVIAIDKTCNKVVGAVFNKIQIKGNTPYFENFAKSWNNKKSKAIVQFMAEFDDFCNFFDHCKIDCLLEFTFLGTLPEYRGRGIGRKLSEISIEIGRNLANSINVKKSIDGSDLPLEPTPKIISAIFSSVVTQKFGRQLGFEIVAEKRFDEFEFEGRNFASVTGNKPPTMTLEYKWLK